MLHIVYRVVFTTLFSIPVMPVISYTFIRSFMCASLEKDICDGKHYCMVVDINDV